MGFFMQQILVEQSTGWQCSLKKTEKFLPSQNLKSSRVDTYWISNSRNMRVLIIEYATYLVIKGGSWSGSWECSGDPHSPSVGIQRKLTAIQCTMRGRRRFQGGTAHAKSKTERQHGKKYWKITNAAGTKRKSRKANRKWTWRDRAASRHQMFS